MGHRSQRPRLLLPAGIYPVKHHPRKSPWILVLLMLYLLLLDWKVFILGEPTDRAVAKALSKALSTTACQRPFAFLVLLMLKYWTLVMLFTLVVHITSWNVFIVI